MATSITKIHIGLTNPSIDCYFDVSLTTSQTMLEFNVFFFSHQKLSTIKLPSHLLGGFFWHKNSINLVEYVNRFVMNTKLYLFITTSVYYSMLTICMSSGELLQAGNDNSSTDKW